MNKWVGMTPRLSCFRNLGIPNSNWNQQYFSQPRKIGVHGRACTKILFTQNTLEAYRCARSIIMHRRHLCLP